MTRGMLVDVNDRKLGDDLAGWLLGCGTDERHEPALNRFKKRILDALVSEARAQGAEMSTAAALCSVTGPEAIADYWLAGSIRRLAEVMFEISVPLRGESRRRRKWKTAPLEVFDEVREGLPMPMQFVVARDARDPDGQYQKWVLYERTVRPLGITTEGAKAMLDAFRRRGRRFRVLLDGRVQVVRCLPMWFAVTTLGMFHAALLDAHPGWVRPESRAELLAVAKRATEVLAAGET